MSTNCLLCGVGGQGTVLASKLIAYAAMQKGAFVRTSETIGMAQRGGCVVSHVRMGDGIFSPLIPVGAADIIIGFEPAEAVRCLPYLKPDGVVVVNQKAVKPTTATLSGTAYDGTEMLAALKAYTPHLIIVDGDAVCAEAGSAKVLNIVLLAAAAESGALGLTAGDLRSAIVKRIPEKFHQMNLRAVDLVCASQKIGGTAK